MPFGSTERCSDNSAIRATQQQAQCPAEHSALSAAIRPAVVQTLGTADIWSYGGAHIRTDIFPVSLANRVHDEPPDSLPPTVRSSDPEPHIFGSGGVEE